MVLSELPFPTSGDLQSDLQRFAAFPVLDQHRLTRPRRDGRVQGIAQGGIETRPRRKLVPSRPRVQLHHVFGQELIHFVVGSVQQQEDYRDNDVSSI